MRARCYRGDSEVEASSRTAAACIEPYPWEFRGRGSRRGGVSKLELMMVFLVETHAVAGEAAHVDGSARAGKW